MPIPLVRISLQGGSAYDGRSYVVRGARQSRFLSLRHRHRDAPMDDVIRGLQVVLQ